VRSPAVPRLTAVVLVGVAFATHLVGGQPASAQPGAPPRATAAVSSSALTGSAAGSAALSAALGFAPATETPVRLSIVAPSATGAWTVRVTNEGPTPVRLAADLRLLAFDVEREVVGAPKNAAVRKGTCILPDSMRPSSFPEARALYLQPGESWVERFDPALFCHGSELSALLAGGAVVRPRLGFSKAAPKAPKPSKPSAKGTKPKPVTGPFVAESTSAPWGFPPARDLIGPALVLSHMPPAPEDAPPVRLAQPPKPRPVLRIAVDPADAEGLRGRIHVARGHAPSGSGVLRDFHSGQRVRELLGVTDEPTPPKVEPPVTPAVVDMNAPVLALEPALFSSASDGRRVQLRLVVRHASGRDTVASFSERDVAFVVEGPEKTVACEADAGERTIARERFRPWKAGSSSRLDVMVSERCPAEAFARPGLYRVRATLQLRNDGKSLGLAAFTGAVRAAASTLVRVESGTEPFYLAPPVALPAPPPPTSDALPSSEPGSPAVVAPSP
jgi:hypothetical protein